MLGKVTPACRVDVRERGITPPVLGAAIGRDDLRQVASRGEPLEQPGRAPGQRIGCHHVGKREDMTPQRGSLVGGLREAVIEGAPSRSRDVHVHAIVGAAAVFAMVEAEA
jgi:hypothetical protein